MDDRLRDLERRAKAGDLDAATQWYREACRTNDIEMQFESMRLMGELQYPGMMETLRQLEEIEKLTGPPYVDGPGVWSNEIIMRDDCGPTGIVFTDGGGTTKVVYNEHTGP